MKTPLPFLLIKNVWDYYFLKWGWVSKTTLLFKLHPDVLTYSVDRPSLHQTMGAFKDLYRFIKNGEFEYHQKTQSMTIFSSKKIRKQNSPFALKRIASIRYLLERDIPFEDSEEESLFKVSIGNRRFFVRKDIPGDAFILDATFLAGEYDFLHPYLAGALVVDVGAYIGDTLALFASWGARKILAFEPHPELYQLAQKNIALNHLEDRVVLRNEGVSSQDGELNIKEDSEAGASAGFGLYQSDRGRTVPIQLVSMKKILEELGRVDVLKMDCEGSEFEILEGLSIGELKKIKVIGLEFHRDPSSIITKLESAGFEVKIINVLKPGQGLLSAVTKQEGSSEHL